MTRDETTTVPATPGGTRPTPPPGRGGWAGAWKAFGMVLLVSGLLWGTYNVVILLAHEERVEHSTYPAAEVTALRVDNKSGSVRIVTGETSEVTVEARISDGLRSTGERQTLDGGVLQLSATCPNFGSNFCDVDYDVVVPQDVPIQVDSGNGRVEITGSTADVSINADNGTVELTGLSGTIDAETDNGRLIGNGLTSADVTADTDNGRIVLTFVAAPRNVVATSNNGRIEVVVPDDGEAYQVTTATDNGSENVDVPTSPNAERTISMSTDNGSVTARLAP